jgi:putative ABC transport system permease protein
MHIRSTLRSLIRTPSFSLAVVLTLALGVGATSAMFGVVYGTLLRPLPYPDAGRLVVVWEKWQVDRDMKGVDPAVAARLAERSLVFTDSLPVWRAENRVFEDLAGYASHAYSVTGTSQPERVEGVVASSSFFRILGVAPALGRSFSAAEDRQGQDEVAVLGHSFWMRRFAGDAHILGKTIGIDGVPHTIVGVMPAGFHLVLPNAPRDPQVITPIPHHYAAGRKWGHVIALARLKPAVKPAAAQSDMESIVKRMAETERRYRTRSVNVVPLSEEMAHDSRTAVLVLFGATICVLLIGCLNVANLLLVRAVARQKDLAIRTAMGAGRWGIARRVVGESLALATVGGLAGLLVAYWGTNALVAAAPAGLFARIEDVAVDRTVLAFGFGVALVVGAVAGLGPAWHALRWDRRGLLNRTLGDGHRTASVSRGQRLVTRGLVAGQVALAMVLLVGAGLLTETYLRLTQVDLGVNPERVLTFGVVLPPARYSSDVSRLAFEEALLARLDSVPGVAAVGLTNSLPVQASFQGSGTLVIEGRPRQDGEFVSLRTVSPGFFGAAGTRLVSGRLLTNADARANVMVVNRAFIQRYLPEAGPAGAAALGRKVTAGKSWGAIVGVIDDVKYSGPERRADPEAYVPLAFWPTGYVAVLMRTEGDPGALISSARAAVRGVDADLPIQDVRTLDEVVSRSVALPQFRLILVALFALLAVVLATIGLYGVIAQSVAQRRQEIGIRMALGAGRSSIAGMVLREGLAIATVGLVVGVGVSISAARLLASFLFGVSATNVPTYVLVAVTLALVTVVVTLGPVLRAARSDPAAVLRAE